jgi:hypothetical protein
MYGQMHHLTEVCQRCEIGTALNGSEDCFKPVSWSDLEIRSAVRFAAAVQLPNVSTPVVATAGVPLGPPVTRC